MYVREHETGKSRKLYTAETDIWLRHLGNGQIIIWLYNRENISDDLQPYICLDSVTGEVVWQDDLTDDEESGILDSGNIYHEFFIGNDVFRPVFVNNTVELWRNGEPYIGTAEQP